MADEIKFGKNSELNINYLNGGLRKGKLNSEAQKLIFETLDKDKNGVLDDNEISLLKSFDSESGNNDGFLDKKEAKSFISRFNLHITNDKGKDEKLKAEEVALFLQEILTGTKGIKTAESYVRDGVSYVKITNDDNSVEIRNTRDNSYTLETMDGDNKVTKFYSSDDVLLTQVVVDKNGKREETDYDEKGETPVSVKLTQGNNVQIYDVVDTQGTRKLVKTIENQGHATLEVKTDYTYTEGNKITKVIQQKDSVKTENWDGENLLSETTEFKNKSIKTEHYENKTVTTTVQGDTTTRKTYNSDGTYTEEIDRSEYYSRTNYNEKGKRLSQTIIKDNQEYNVEYDGNGNTYIIVQNKETVGSIAQKFLGSDSAKNQNNLLRLNNSQYHKDGLDRLYFVVGTKIKVPGELAADDTRFFGRKDEESVKDDYQTSGGADNEAYLTAEMDSRHRTVTYRTENLPNIKTFKDFALWLYENEGNPNPTDNQLAFRITELKRLNKDVIDGKFNEAVRLTAEVSEERFNVFQDRKDIRKLDEKDKKKKEEIATQANNLISYLDPNNKSHIYDTRTYNKFTKCIHPSDVADVLDYLYNTKGLSIIELIDNSGMVSNLKEEAKKEVRDYLIYSMKYAKMPLTSEELKQLRIDNQVQFDTVAQSCIARLTANKYKGDEITVSVQDSMNIVSGWAKDMNIDTQKEYHDAREKDDNAAKIGDWFCGLFGCKTVDDMDAKLKTYDTDIQALVAVAKANKVEEFKKLYKKIFGRYFKIEDVQKYQNAMDKYATVVALDGSYQFYKSLENKMSGSLSTQADYKRIMGEWLKEFNRGETKVKQADIELMVQNFALNHFMQFNTPKEKLNVMKAYASQNKQNAYNQKKLEQGGKSINEIEQDVNTCQQALFGANGILLPEVQEFNKNMEKTSAYTAMALEIGATVAMMAIPGLGAATLTKLAVSTGRMGAIGVRISRLANTGAKCFNFVSSTMNSSNLVVRIGTNGLMTATGSSTGQAIATGKVDLKRTFKAGFYGAFVSVAAKVSELFVEKLATKLTEALGERLIQESSEAILNAATVYAGELGNYAVDDATLDIAMDFIMARLGGSKGHPSKTRATASSNANASVAQSSQTQSGVVTSAASASDVNPSRVSDTRRHKTGKKGDVIDDFTLDPDKYGPKPQQPVENGNIDLGNGIELVTGNGVKSSNDGFASTQGNTSSGVKSAIPSKPKLVEDNVKDVVIELDGKKFTVTGVRYDIFINGEYIPNYEYFAPVNDLLQQGVATPEIRQMLLNSPDGKIDVRKLEDLIFYDQRLSMIEDSQIRDLVVKKICNGNSYTDNIDLVLDAQLAFEGRLSIVDSMMKEFNDYVVKQGKTIEDFSLVCGFKTDMLLENRMYGIRQYMKSCPNTEISNYMYSKYLKELELVGIEPRLINTLKNIDSEYGCKVILSSNVKESSEVLSLINSEFVEWKRCGGAQVKYPPVIDFSTVKSMWYDSTAAYGQGFAAAYSERRYDGSLAFSKMTRNMVEYALRHEMTHTNDLRPKVPQDVVNKIMVKKPVLDENGVQKRDSSNCLVFEAELDKCMYVDEFRKVGIPESHIEYAYNNTAEFIAVASEGDLSKYSDEFRQLLVDFGMPEWQLNMKPKTDISKDIPKHKDASSYTRVSGVSTYVEHLFGNNIRQQGPFSYRERTFSVISPKKFDPSGLYIGNKINAMCEMLEGKLPKDAGVIVASDAKIRLADSWTLDLSDPRVKEIIDNLNEGQILVVGAEGNIRPTRLVSGINDRHIEICKVDGEIVVRDTSERGAVILGASGPERSQQIAGRMKNYLTSILVDDIAPELKGLWKTCKSEIEDLAKSLTLPEINIDVKKLKVKYQSVMKNLSVLMTKVTGNLKVQLQNLFAKIKDMIDSLNLKD